MVRQGKEKPSKLLNIEKLIMSETERYEQALRYYEKVHQAWMNLSVFTAEGQAARLELNAAGKALDLARASARRKAQFPATPGHPDVCTAAE
jgi:hypothetical protein